MDGCWWFCHCDTGSRLFVNEIHGEIDHARAFTEWWQFSQGSSEPDRGTTRSTTPRDSVEEVATRRNLGAIVENVGCACHSVFGS
jgi:hypothetical protein